MCVKVHGAWWTLRRFLYIPLFSNPTEINLSIKPNKILRGEDLGDEGEERGHQKRPLLCQQCPISALPSVPPAGAISWFCVISWSGTHWLTELAAMVEMFLHVLSTTTAMAMCGY